MEEEMEQLLGKLMRIGLEDYTEAAKEDWGIYADGHDTDEEARKSFRSGYFDEEWNGKVLTELWLPDLVEKFGRDEVLESLAPFRDEIYRQVCLEMQGVDPAIEDEDF